MPKRPDVLCAGSCGRLIWSGSGCLPPGQAMCRACRAEVRSTKPRPPRARPRFSATCETCSVSFRARTRKQRYCSVACRNVVYRELRRPGWRTQNHQRRTKLRMTDVTIEYERALRRKAKTCPLCKVRLVSVPFTPQSKELDHILPINVGGTHTVGNVRFICRLCNQRRPKDGSDYVGQLTLWAEDAAVVAGLPPAKTRPKAPACSLCGVSTDGGRSRCDACRFDVRGRRAADLRAQGMSWREVSLKLGYANESGAYLAARKYGDRNTIARWPKYVSKGAMGAA